jgi:hypothetical protein
MDDPTRWCENDASDTHRAWSPNVQRRSKKMEPRLGSGVPEGAFQLRKFISINMLGSARGQIWPLNLNSEDF